MESLQNLYESAKSFLPSGAVIVVFIILLAAVRQLLDRRFAGRAGRQFRRQIATLILVLIGLLVLILVLPINDSVRGQLLSLTGILLSAVLALSATTFVGKIMGGLMLRGLRSFGAGDFVSVGEYFGRVSGRGMFHVEIQTEERDLITMPNLYLVTNPVRVVRGSGTIVWAEVSLGYDVPHAEAERLLLEAAEETGLDEGFVHIMDLGDYSVTYRVSGLLVEVKRLLSTRSLLRQRILDRLHGGGIEIASPTLMNTRAYPPDRQYKPPVSVHKPMPDEAAARAEALAFDKADRAESIEKLREWQASIEKEIETVKKSLDETELEADRKSAEARIDSLKAQQARLEELIKRKEESEEG
jgi:small conductance mechanosensitive channel